MNFDEIRAVTSELIRSDRQAAAILKKIASGKATFADTMKYSLICSKVTSKQLASVIGEPDEELEELAGALLRDRYDDINTSCSAVQRALDEKNALHLAPQKAAFPSERVAKFAHSLIDPTVSDETIKRRAKSGSANITMSFHDDFIKENADFRTKAGLECYVERQTDGKCCPWCSAVAGRYLMREQPKDLFRRHDNCECVIIYDEKVLRGAVGANGRRGKKWTDSGERAERIKFAESQKPTVFSHDEAEKLQAELLPRRLTGGSVKLSRQSNGETNSLLTSAKPTAHSADELSKIETYAKALNIRIYNIRSFDGDTELLKEQIDAIDEARKEFDINNHKIAIRFGTLDDPNADLAETNQRGDCIEFNYYALRDRQITENFMNSDDCLAATQAKGIAYHEMGHVISKKHGEIGLDIAAKAYYNIFKKTPNRNELLNYLESNISDYSVSLHYNARKPYGVKDFKEITPEIYSKNKTAPSEFTEEFVKLLKEAYRL